MDSRRRYGVRVVARRRRSGGVDHVVSVRTTIGRLAGVAGSPVEIIDSGQFDPSGLDHAGFDAATRAAHGDHRDDARAQKGRVIYLTAGGAVAGFVAFHVPPAGPFIVERLAIDARYVQLAPASTVAMQWELLAVVLEASEAAGRASSILAWATDNPASAQVVETAFRFQRARKPKGSDSRLKYYFERSYEPDPS